MFLSLFRKKRELGLSTQKEAALNLFRLLEKESSISWGGDSEKKTLYSEMIFVRGQLAAEPSALFSPASAPSPAGLHLSVSVGENEQKRVRSHSPLALTADDEDTAAAATAAFDAESFDGKPAPTPTP